MTAFALFVVSILDSAGLIEMRYHIGEKTSQTADAILAQNSSDPTSLLPGSLSGMGGFPGVCGSGEIHLVWQVSERTTGYRIVRGEALVSTTETTGFVDTGLQASTTYNYIVYPFNATGSGQGSYISILSPKTCLTGSGDSGGTSTSTTTYVTPTGTGTYVTPTGTYGTPSSTNTTTTTSYQYPTPQNTYPTPTYTYPTPTYPYPTPKDGTGTTSLPVTKPPLSATTSTSQREDGSAFTAEQINKLQDISSVIERTREIIVQTRERLFKLIDTIIDEALNRITDQTQRENIISQMESLRERLKSKIESDLKGLTNITPEKIEALTKEVKIGLEEARAIVKDTQVPIIDDSGRIKEAFGNFTSEIQNRFKDLKERGGDLLYKDSNNDGVSDYDASRIYNLDPVKSSPTSLYEGRKIKAQEKILLGFDPTKEALTKIRHEEPSESQAIVSEINKLEKVELSTEKRVVLKGLALPNSFVTLYIYSTPIIVTVKTDENGQWQYTMDEELPDGEHTVYTTTVNNTGRIMAKSPGYIFVKTAEAATLGTLPTSELSNVSKPGLLTNKNFILILSAIVLIGMLALLWIGFHTKEIKPPTQNPQ